MADAWSTRGEANGRDTVFALSTPLGRSAVAVIRLSGPRTAEVLRRLTGRELAPRRATLSSIRDASGEIMDTGLALWFPGPASFTGEDCAELHLHGSLATVRAVVDALGQDPALRPARPGEFTRRAFEHGKLTVEQAEALADLIDAQTERQRRLALRAGDAGPVRLATGWRDQCLDTLAAIDAELDFADEGDVQSAAWGEIASRLDMLCRDITAEIARGERAKRVREGFTVAICGPPNSGKSTLLNALAGREQAIVSPHAGTTRDVIEVTLDLRGLAVTVCDTAGIRVSNDPVEAIGIERARLASCRADLTIWLQAPDAPAEPDAGMQVDVRLFSKADLAMVPDGVTGISGVTGEGIAGLVDFITERAAVDLDELGDAVSLRARHLEAARAMVVAVATTADHVRAEQPEIAAAFLRDALAQAEALGSKVADEDILDRIFGRFCIGK